MFTNTKAGYVRDGKVLTESACLSTDTKPTEGIANGSCLIEMDTGDTYAFDETGAGTWRKLSSSGGGGSSLPAVTSDDNGDVLTVVNGAWDKASPSGGGGNFVVTFSTEDYQTFTADKTFQEISSAYFAGQNIIAYESSINGEKESFMSIFVREETDEANNLTVQSFTFKKFVADKGVEHNLINIVLVELLWESNGDIYESLYEKSFV